MFSAAARRAFSVRCPVSAVRKHLLGNRVGAFLSNVVESQVIGANELVVFIAGRGGGRRVESIARVEGLDPGGDYALRLLDPDS